MISIEGTNTGTVATNYGFTAVVGPMTATKPITYLWQATEQPLQNHVGKLEDNATFFWRTNGQKAITVTAMNAGGTVTGTHVVTILDAEPFTSTGYAVTVPITPTDLLAWKVCTLTTFIPLGTSMSVSILDATLNPLPGLDRIPLNDGVTTVELEQVTPAAHPSLRLRVDLTSTVPTLSPDLTEWQVTAVAGDVYEPDDTCAQASAIPVDGAIQHHTFHDQRDMDWVSFDTISGTTYVVQANSTSEDVDLMLELYDICDHPIVSDTNTLGSDAHIVFQASASDTYYVKASNYILEASGSDMTYDLSVRAQAPGGVVLIVAGHDDGFKLQDNILYAANLAYRTFRRGSIPKDHIRYLSTIDDDRRTDADGDGISDVHASSASANVEAALTNWAVNLADSQTPFYLYLIDHGLVDNFKSYGDNDTITPIELDRWLNVLENSTGTPVSVIYEACHSGSFIDGIDEISAPGRVVIASTGRQNSAYVFPNRGAYFSDAFFTALGQSQDLYTSFQRGLDTLEANPMYWQTPWLDDNGNGIPNDDLDGVLARGRGLSNFASSSERPPVIDQVSPPGSIRDGEGALRARVRDDGELAQVTVWAIVYPPSFEEPEPLPDGTMPDLDLPLLILSDTDQDGEFVGVYESFTEAGIYRAVTYAEDAEGNLSRPVAVEVQTEWTVYLPLVLRES
jgi:hypothetical protein